MSHYKVTGKYSYNAICESCGFKHKASELKYRWDGKWVCPEDWEYRHPTDFYRNRSDVHPLPFIRSDKGDVVIPWTPAYSNLTVTLNGGETQDTASNDIGSYVLLQSTKSVPRTYGRVGLTFLDIYGVRQGQPKSTTSSDGTITTITLPTTPGGAGTLSILTTLGKYLGQATIVISNATVTLPAWTSAQGGLLFSADYLT